MEQGERIPATTVKRLTAGGTEDLAMTDYCAGRKVVLFGVPGAFTPTCSDTHLPGFQARADDLRARGADAIACIAVNDPFVVGAWAQARGVGETIDMLSDGSGAFARDAGLQLDLSGVGMGMRNKRFAAIVDDGVVTYLGVEPGREVGVSSADAVLERL